MNPKNLFKPCQAPQISPILPKDLHQLSQKLSHRRTSSKASIELQFSLKPSSPIPKFPSPILGNKPSQVTTSHKALKISKKTNSEETFSDEELNIRHLIEQRKILSPISYKDLKTQNFEKNFVNTSSATLTVNEENNLNRVLFALKNRFLTGENDKCSFKTIEELMKKCTETCFALALDSLENLRGIYYLEQSTGYFHRIIADNDSPIVLPPRRIKDFMFYDANTNGFVKSNVNRFEAFVYTV